MLFEEAWDILNYIHDSTKGMDSVLEWEEAIEKYEKNLQESGSREDGIHLITMHGCKGLEFPYVFLPDCNEGKIPHNKAFLKEDVEEERRMFYVAMTRAMEQLEILYIKDPEGRKLPPSRFLDPLTGQKTKKHIKKENDKNILLKTVSNFFSH